MEKNIMQQIWKEVLKLDELPGLNESFFELGGNSFIASKACQMFYDKCGIELEISDFYDHETIDELVG